ncbi:MAG: AAA family ATPase [Vicinamibacterales bacterium]
MRPSGSSSIPSILAHEQYFGFQQRPFELSPDPRFLYRSASHDAATGQLIQALDRGEGFLVLAGDMGTGKTTLCRNLLNLLGPTSFTSLILNPFLSADELLRQVLRDFGVVSREAGHDARFSEASTHALTSTLHEFLQSLAAIGGRVVIIIDEAQHLSKEVLEQIRVLSNLEASDAKLLQIVLVGQLNLLDTLNHADMRQYAQRISLRATLTPLTREETEAYIRHRITVAVPRREVAFSPEALQIVHTTSKGIPRVINLLCDRALAFTAQDSETTVTVPHVRQAAAALNLTTAPPPEVFQTFADTRVPEPRNRRRLLVTGLAVVLVAVAIGVTLWLRPLPAWVDDAVQPALPGRPPASIRPDTSASDVRPEDIVIPPPPARGLDDDDP